LDLVSVGADGARGAVGPAATDPAAGWWLCWDEDCPTIYFRGSETVTAEGVDALPWHKNPEDPAQLVCFCFQHTVAAVRADTRAHGVSTLRASIQAACARGEDDCERTNPQGRCCLGNVGAVVRGVAVAAGGSPFVILPVAPSAPPDEGGGGGCGTGCGCSCGDDAAI